ncbi:unnamed protein product [Closterium sp. Naga37s-1]|nr:unnamed protein product [Closterium sp. Naga37s-1]CAI5517175.1 unnamed protein product [Closterium sp. Naga37s-1]
MQHAGSLTLGAHYRSSHVSSGLGSEQGVRLDEEARRREREEEEVARLLRQMVRASELDSSQVLSHRSRLSALTPPTPLTGRSTKQHTMHRSPLLHTNARHTTAAANLCGSSLRIYYYALVIQEACIHSQL